MRFYLDTSTLVAAHTLEPSTAFVQAWIAKQNAAELVVSTWVLVECESALSIKERRNEITQSEHLTASAAVTQFVSRLAPLVTATEADFKSAAQLCKFAASRLRAGDALHLALALRLKVQGVVTLDRVFDENVAMNGLQGGLLSE